MSLKLKKPASFPTSQIYPPPPTENHEIIKDNTSVIMNSTVFSFSNFSGTIMDCNANNMNHTIKVLTASMNHIFLKIAGAAKADGIATSKTNAKIHSILFSFIALLQPRPKFYHQEYHQTRSLAKLI